MKWGLLAKLKKEELTTIDDQIAREVAPFVKKFAVLPPDVQDAAYAAANSYLPTGFLNELVNAWAEHNRLASIIDTFLVNSFDFSGGTFLKKHLLRAERLLRQAIDAERRKRIISAAVKPALEIYTRWAQERFGITDEETWMLLTPPQLNFWSTYEVAHLQLIVKERSLGSCCYELRKRLAEKFHAEELAVLQTRLAKQFPQYLEYSTELI